MTVDIPFDAEWYRIHNQKNFDSIWKGNLKKNNQRLIYGPLALILGGWFLYKGHDWGYLVVGLAICYLSNFITYRMEYAKRRKVFLATLEEEIEGFKQSGEPVHLEFESKYLGYKDHKFETKIKWKYLLQYRVINDGLFLDLDPNRGVAYLINKSGLSTEQWEEVLQFVKDRVRPAES